MLSQANGSLIPYGKRESLPVYKRRPHTSTAKQPGYHQGVASSQTVTVLLARTSPSRKQTCCERKERGCCLRFFSPPRRRHQAKVGTSLEYVTKQKNVYSGIYTLNTYTYIYLSMYMFVCVRAPVYAWIHSGAYDRFLRRIVQQI